jgi:hypothetical protein
MKECVQLMERVLGLDHPFTSSSRGALIQWEIKDLELESSRAFATSAQSQIYSPLSS